MKLIFDIGANVGNKTNEYLLVSDKVVAFEANPFLVSHLMEKFKNNPKVVVDNRGISDKKEIKVFKIANNSGLSTFSEDWINKSRFSNKDIRWDIHFNVQTTTMDSIIEEYGTPDFIKIDVEGYELEVLLGLSSLLENTILSFEWAEEEYKKINKTIEHVKSLGYTQFGFTYEDDTSFGENIKWSSWWDCEIHNDINPERKEKWGMIYFKK
jgi:FkbM family methyltransferase